MQANLCCEARMAVGNSRMMCRRISSAIHHRDSSQSAQFQSLLFQWLPEMSSHSQKPKEFSRKTILHFVGTSLDWITTNRNVILIERLISVARTRLSFRFDRIKRLLASSLLTGGNASDGDIEGRARDFQLTKWNEASSTQAYGGFGPRGKDGRTIVKVFNPLNGIWRRLLW